MSEIRVNTFKAEDGISAPSFPNGIQVTGIVTSTVLDASVSTLNVTGGHINVGSNIQLGDAGILTATTFKGNIEGTTGTFLGNVSIGGTLTYEDVSNIDAVGLITARNGVSISSGGLKVLGGGSNFNANITGTATTALSVTAADESSDTSCNVLFATAATGNVAPKTGTNLTFNSSNGTLTATSFAGSGSGITGVPAANLTGTAAAINGSNITNLTAANLTGALPAISGANLTGVVTTNLVTNTTATEQSATANASIITADIVLSKNNPYLVILGVVSINTRSHSTLDEENIKFDLQYSTNGGSSYSEAVGNVYSTDVFAPGQDDTHNNQYDINTRPANGRFQITANAGTTVRIRILLDYGSVQNSQTIYINRGASSAGQGTSSILIYEE